MERNELRFEEGPFEPAQLTAWADAIEQKYPDYRNMTDRAPALIAGPLTVLGSRNLFVCLDGEDLVGLLRYVKYAPDDPGGQRIEIIQFAVLPSHQRRRIGSTLIGLLQDMGRGRAPIFAGFGILPPAVIPLTRAEFRPITNRRGHTVYKWSDLPEQQNDRLPEDDTE